jgi:hypothetical protein
MPVASLLLLATPAQDSVTRMDDCSASIPALYTQLLSLKAFTEFGFSFVLSISRSVVHAILSAMA